MAAKKAQRAPLTTVAERMPAKNHVAASPADTPAPPAPEAAAPAPAEAEAKGADQRVPITVRMNPTERKALRQIALDRDTTVQALVEEGIRDLLRRYGVTPA